MLIPSAPAPWASAPLDGTQGQRALGAPTLPHLLLALPLLLPTEKFTVGFSSWASRCPS